jgi:hypothetical protein
MQTTDVTDLIPPITDEERAAWREEWTYWERARPPHALRSFPSLTDAIRPDHAEPEHLADLAAALARTGGTVTSAWQWANPTDTRRRIRTWRTVWRLGIVRPDRIQSAGPMRFRLADRETIARDAEQMTPEDRAKALAYGSAIYDYIAAAIQRRAVEAVRAAYEAATASVVALRDYRRQPVRRTMERRAVPNAAAG